MEQHRYNPFAVLGDDDSDNEQIATTSVHQKCSSRWSNIDSKPSLENNPFNRATNKTEPYAQGFMINLKYNDSSRFENRPKEVSERGVSERNPFANKRRDGGRIESERDDDSPFRQKSRPGRGNDLDDMPESPFGHKKKQFGSKFSRSHGGVPRPSVAKPVLPNTKSFEEFPSLGGKGPSPPSDKTSETTNTVASKYIQFASAWKEYDDSDFITKLSERNASRERRRRRLLRESIELEQIMKLPKVRVIRETRSTLLGCNVIDSTGKIIQFIPVDDINSTHTMSRENGHTYECIYEECIDDTDEYNNDGFSDDDLSCNGDNDVDHGDNNKGAYEDNGGDEEYWKRSEKATYW